MVVKMTNLGEAGIHYFTVKWCGHCQTLKEELGPKPKPPFLHHDLGEGEGISKEKNIDVLKKNGFDKIEGFPTIYFKTKTGKTMEYNDERKKTEMIDAYESFCDKEIQLLNMEVQKLILYQDRLQKRMILANTKNQPLNKLIEQNDKNNINIEKQIGRIKLCS